MKCFILIVLLLIFSCGPDLKEGEVYDKEFIPAHMQIILMPVTTCGKTCMTSLIPVPFFYPDAWKISYKAFNKDENQYDTSVKYVPKAVFDSLEIGHWYISTDKDLKEPARMKQ